MLAPVVNSLPRGPLSSKREEEREREPSRGFLYIVRFLLRFVSFWIPFPPITEDESNLGRATLSMLFLSNPGSMANVFLLSNRFLPRGRFSNNNIPPFPFLFALSFPVFLFHFLFFFRDEKISIAGNNVNIDRFRRSCTARCLFYLSSWGILEARYRVTSTRIFVSRVSSHAS